MKTMNHSVSQQRISQKELSESNIPVFQQIKNMFAVRHMEQPVRRNGRKINVFLVDDDPLYLKALELSISSHFDWIEVHSFQTGEACLQQIKKKPGVVILDYYLNTKLSYAWNGITILKQIKKLYPKTKVIMLSSQDSLNVAIDCMENGAYDYISKSRTALMRINNCISNIFENTEEEDSSMFQKFKYAVFVIIFIILLYALLKY